MAYSSDADLIKIRPNILDFGYDNYDDQHTEAKRQIDRDIEAGWYYSEAAIRGYSPTITRFDPTLISDASQLLILSCYKTLSLIYEFLAKDLPEDGLSTMRDYYEKKYKEELAAVIGYGITYDWEDDGIDDSDLSTPTPPRRLHRC